jgi:hypothetical protein
LSNNEVKRSKKEGKKQGKPPNIHSFFALFNAVPGFKPEPEK